MNNGKFVFSQVLSLVNRYEFQKCVNRYKGDYRTRGLNCWNQFAQLFFGQLTARNGLRDICLCLNAHKNSLYHLGIKQRVNQSTLSRANENRDWRIFRDFTLKLIERAKTMYAGTNNLDVDLKGGIYALDSSIVDLCITVFWWATFRSTKSAIKIHTLLDLKTAIPEYIYITEASMHDVNILDKVDLPAGSYLIMDRAYVDFIRLQQLAKDRINFVVRAKSNINYQVLDSGIPDTSSGIISDQAITLAGYTSSKKYKGPLRLVRYYDCDTDREFLFITNNFKISATTIAALYKSRWGIELFFKWIKQHLKIKSFWGQSENAVKSQIWIAIASYVVVAIAKKQLNLEYSLYEILQLISLAPFDRTPIPELFLNADYQNIKEQNHNQLKMF